VIEVKGNLWTFPADVRVITTNGTVKRNGEAVMGRGCAAEAAQRWPTLPANLGDHLIMNGNIPCFFLDDGDGFDLITFPVKHQWHERADIELIEKSAVELVKLVLFEDNPTVVMPRPGCGNGHLRWEDVRPLLEPILDDRFHVITF